MPQVTVGQIEALTGPAVQCVELDAREYLLVQRQGQFYLLDNLCPHKAAALCDGDLIDDAIQCPWHKARFDIQTGRGLSPLAGAGVKSYSLSECDGQLLAELD